MASTALHSPAISPLAVATVAVVIWPGSFHANPGLSIPDQDGPAK